MNLPDHWLEIPLEKIIVDMQSGFAQRPNANNQGTSQLRTNNVSPEGNLDLSSIVYVKASQSDLEKYGVKKGDVVFNTNSIEWVGKTAFFDVEGEYVLSNHMTRLRVQPDVADAEYLSRYLHYLWQTGTTRRWTKQRVNQAAIDQLALAQFQVIVPPLPEQRRIVEILRQADELRSLRRQADEKANQFLPALFEEMFGDPAINPKKWPVGNLGEVIHAAQDGPHVSPKYTDSGVPFLSTRNIRAGQIIWENIKYISEEEAKIHWKKCRPQIGDILYTKGGTTGLAKAIDFEIPIAVWVHIALLKTNLSAVDPYWLECMLNTTYCYKQSQDLTHGIANRDLGLSRMKKIKLYLPPLILQRLFAEQYKQTQLLLGEQEKASQSLNKLFQAILAQAFTGELTKQWREEHQEELAAARERDQLLGKAHIIVGQKQGIEAPAQIETHIESIATVEAEEFLEQGFSYAALKNLFDATISDAPASALPAAFTEGIATAEDFDIEHHSAQRLLEAMAATSSLLPAAVLTEDLEEEIPHFVSAFRPTSSDDEARTDFSSTE